jgi:hypothetical protein
MTTTETLHPLSMQQEFLCMFDKGDEVGPFGPRYHIVDGWRISGRIDTEVLRQALFDVVERHEALRTTVVRHDGHGQRVHPPTQPRLSVQDIGGVDVEQRPTRAEEFMNAIEAGTFSSTDVPFLRASLLRFDDQDSVLVLNSHHTATDAWSMQVIMRDLMVFYARRNGFPAPDLPEADRYRDFAARQWADAEAPATRKTQAYWRTKLDGARILALTIDDDVIADKPGDSSLVTSWYRFTYDADIRDKVTAVARANLSSSFMVLLAAYSVFIARETGTQDVVSPTFTPGRGQAGTQNTVGSFFNFVPLRVDLRQCGTFRDVLRLARASCLEGYANELPLGLVLQEAPDLMSPTTQPGRVPCVFQAVQSPFTSSLDRVGDLAYSAIWDRRISQPVGSDIPDGMLWSFHFGPSPQIAGLIGYSRSLFNPGTVERMAAGYGRALRDLLADPDQPI